MPKAHPKYKNRPRRHSRARSRLLLNIDTQILRMTHQLERLRALRWDVDNDHDMQRARTYLNEVDGAARQQRLEADNEALRARLLVVEEELDELVGRKLS
jgi:hypothetical protein